MPVIKRSFYALGIIALAAAVVVVGLSAGAPAAAGAAPQLTPTAAPPFTATLSLTADRPAMLLGSTLTLTADLVTSGCGYHIMDLTVTEDPARPPLFAHIDPPDDTIGPGISFPSAWTFRAEREGTTRFLAQTFGETDCNDAWSWHYEGAASPSIEVYDLPIHVWLPTISSR